MVERNASPRKKRIGILVFDGFEPIDVWGFVQAFSIARFIGTGYSQDTNCPFEVLLIANETRRGGGSGVPAPVKSWNGPRVAPDMFRDDALQQPFDVIMIPGGQGVSDMLDSGDVSDHPYQSQFEAFFAALERGEDMPLTSLAESLKSHRAVLAADMSAELGREVKMSEVK